MPHFPSGNSPESGLSPSPPANPPPGQTRGPRLARLKSGNALDPKNQRVDSLASMEIAEPHFLDSAMAFLTRNGTPGDADGPLKGAVRIMVQAVFQAGKKQRRDRKRLFRFRTRVLAGRHESTREEGHAEGQSSSPRNSCTSRPGLNRPMRLISHCRRMPECSSTRARTVSPRYSRS